MNLKNKLKNLPPIWLLHLDERPDRLEYTESQYDYWEISDYKKCSGSKYRPCTFNEWKDLVVLNPLPKEYKSKKRHILEVCITISYLINLKKWLETTNDPYVIFMEDDYDLDLIKYWHFDWEYLMNNIPYDWDCIQLSFENNSTIPCFLHPIISGHGTGASLINRRYAEKIIQLHYKDGKFDLSKKISNYKYNFCGSKDRELFGTPNLTVDYFFGHNGKTYCIPLISVNNNLGSYDCNISRKDEREDLSFTRKAYKKWWTRLRDRYTLEDFFTYGKPNDRIITKKEKDLDKYV